MKSRKFIILKPGVRSLLVGAVILSYIFLILKFPAVSAQGAIDGLVLSAQIIIPSLFPFTVASLFIFKCGFIDTLGKYLTPIARPLFGVSGSGAAAMVLSFVAGYPAGAGLIDELYRTKKITLCEANRLICYSINSGPTFILSAVAAGIMNNRGIGVILLTCHILGSITMALFLGRFKIKDQLVKPLKPEKSDGQVPAISDAFVSATAQSTSIIIGVCGWVVLFSSVIAVLAISGLPSAFSNTLSSICEITTGIKFIVGITANPVLISAMLGWSGFSVICQVLTSTKSFSPSFFKIMISRITHAGLSALFTFIALIIFPQTVMVISNGQQMIKHASFVSLPASVALIFFCIVFLFFTKPKSSVEISDRI